MTARVARGEEVLITLLNVPEHVRRGDDVELGCRWLAPREKLYSVKWYLNDREFFSYKPEETPSLVIYPLPGVNVDRELSTGERIILNDVQLTSSGKYKCEVIAEWPNFHTADKSGPMTVVDVPEEKPRITGTQHQYHIGDTAHLTCTSARSLPPAQLTWYINDEEAPTDYVVLMNDTRYNDELVESHKGLRFVVSRQHFRNGEMTLRCSAKISSLYYKTQQHSVDGQLTYNVPVMESRDISAMSGGAPCGHRQLLVMLVGMTVLVEVLAGVLGNTHR
ncbi:junctional adhesion molecule 2A-like [Panulirus ornatus]|uniref:junctional adhesion molecule 2A-like n=1 Tax=Panulirus ornatus TaxID=150431 RepID=UPI003A8935BC